LDAYALSMHFRHPIKPARFPLLYNSYSTWVVTSRANTTRKLLCDIVADTTLDTKASLVDYSLLPYCITIAAIKLTQVWRIVSGIWFTHCSLLSSILCYCITLHNSHRQILETMRSNPTAAFDKSLQAQTHLRATQATKQLAKLAIKYTSKRAAKKDNHSCHKARAWRMKGTFAVSSSLVKLSRIDWIWSYEKIRKNCNRLVSRDRHKRLACYVVLLCRVNLSSLKLWNANTVTKKHKPVIACVLTAASNSKQSRNKQTQRASVVLWSQSVVW